MKLIVWKVGDWKPGRYLDKATNKIYDVKRVAFKAVDPNDKKTYYINLDKKQPQNVDKWEKHLVEGNVLDCVIMPKGGLVTNDTTINKFESFTVVKTVSTK
jgi:hypothetical protein